MARIPDEELENLKRNTDLEALVRGRGVDLKPHGAKDLIGRCPMPGHEDGTASFVVTPSKNLFHCFGCGAKGGPIDFVMQTQGLDFRAAVDRLLEGGPVCRVSNAALHKTAAKKEAEAALPEERAQVLLARAVAIYAQNMNACPEGRAYLEVRGITDMGLLERHSIGYSTGRLSELLPQSGSLKEELTSLGLLLENGRERFTGCLVFPVKDTSGRIVSLYGRYTGTAAGAEGKRHVFLPGRPQGLWNVAAAKAATQVILVESVLDALSVEIAGHSNVIAIHGTNGLGDSDMMELRTEGVYHVRLLLDGDEAGQQAMQRLKKEMAPLFFVETITLPEGEDPNSYLVKHGAPALASLLVEKSQSVAKGGQGYPPLSELMQPAEGQVISLPGGFSVQWGLRDYEVRGLERTLRALKATIRVQKSGRLHVDTLDLYSARARRQLALDLVRIFEETADTIEADLNKLLSVCEDRSHTQEEMKEAEKTPRTLDESERRQGETFGRKADLIEQILSDYERCGLVGERANKLLCYLVMSSRKMPRPLAVLNLASSGAGKTALQDGCLAFCPPEDLVKLTSISGKALFYKERDSLRHKVLALEEGDGVSEAMYALRNLISAGELVTESTIKDPATGRLVTMANKVEGPTAVFLTTTNPDTDPETKSRFFVTSVDEGREQTEAILKYQRKRYTLEGLKEQTEATDIYRRHHAFQRTLRPLPVVNPFAEQLRYGDSRLPSRRDQPKYLGLIATVAFLRQMQKKVKRYSGREYIEVDREDVKIANDLATELLGHCLAELSRPGYELLLVLDKMRSASEEAAKREKVVSAFTFTRRQVREFAGWAHARVHRYLSELTELEYVASEGSRNGFLHRYQLLWEGQGKDGGRFLLGLCAPEELREGKAE